MVGQSRLHRSVRRDADRVLLDDRSDEESYLQKWDRWVNDDYYKSYIEQLGKLGLEMDAGPFMGARERIATG